MTGPAKAGLPAGRDCPPRVSGRRSNVAPLSWVGRGLPALPPWLTHCRPRDRAKITSDSPATFGTRPWPRMENWSLKICHWQLKTPPPIADDRFSIFKSQWPSNLRLVGANSTLLELRLMIGTCFCTAPKPAGRGAGRRQGIGRRGVFSDPTIR